MRLSDVIAHCRVVIAPRNVCARSLCKISVVLIFEQTLVSAASFVSPGLQRSLCRKTVVTFMKFNATLNFRWS